MLDEVNMIMIVIKKIDASLLEYEVSIKQFKTITMSFVNRYYDEEWGQFITLDTVDLNPTKFYTGTNSSIMMDSTYSIDIESCGEGHFDTELTSMSDMNDGSVVSLIIDTVIHSVASLVYYIAKIQK